MANQQDAASFRDPAGTIFYQNGIVKRQVNQCYQRQYDALMESGLYRQLTTQKLLIPHQEVSLSDALDAEKAYRVIAPEQLAFISYPYEWCFGQYKAAALATLKLHRAAMEHGMILKDASAYNIQPYQGGMVLIDTLSFDFYTEGQVWMAYGQFCRHFLAPLFLMAYVDVRLSQLMRVYIDGIPLDLASKLLKGKGGMAVLQHIHWHAKATVNHAQDGKNDAAKSREIKIPRINHLAMIDSLIRIVEGLAMKDTQTEWGDYYEHTNYSDRAALSKSELVKQYTEIVKPQTVWDFGANNGHYSRIATELGAFVVAFDIDPVAVECNYQALRSQPNCTMLPLLLDLTNPSPAIGFANRERLDIASRQTPDMLYALAIIHHLAISNNLPLPRIAQWLSTLSPYLIMEFVPKEDSQVQTLLKTRDDIFADYHEEGFEAAFNQYFDIIEKNNVEETCRTLYLLKSKSADKA